MRIYDWRIMSPIVSVIIVSYNTKSLLLDCIAKIPTSSLPKDQIEIIVVDNHSTDGTLPALSSAYPTLKVIKNTVNRGFGGANNQGADVAQGKYLLFLNTDAFLTPAILPTLISYLDSHPRVVAVGPKYLYPDGRFQPSAGYFPTLTRVMGWMWGLDRLPILKYFFPRPYHQENPNFYQSNQEVEWLMGACILLRRRDFAAVSGFDSKIFMYCEEVELFLRLNQKTGMNCIYESSVSITHIGSASTKKSGASRLVQELRGIEYLYAKHYPGQLGYLRLLLYTGVLLRLIVFAFIPAKHEAMLEYKKYFQNT